MFKVYDKVWIMKNNQPKEKLVFSVIEGMDYSKKGTETYYGLVDSVIGSGFGNDEGIKLHEQHVFSSKEELINSL